MSMNDCAPLVQLNQINVSFSGRQVLKNVDLHIYPHEIVTLVDPMAQANRH